MLINKIKQADLLLCLVVIIFDLSLILGFGKILWTLFAIHEGIALLYSTIITAMIVSIFKYGLFVRSWLSCNIRKYILMIMFIISLLANIVIQFNYWNIITLVSTVIIATVYQFKPDAHKVLHVTYKESLINF